MAGVGSELAGIGLAGPGSAQTPGAFSATPYLQASYYDPSTRDFKLITGGYVASIHPVDQECILALTVPEGSIPSALDVGSRFHRIEYLGRKTASEVDGYARYALRAPIERGDVRFIASRIEIPRETRGLLLIDVEYLNLVLALTGYKEKQVVRVPTSLKAA